MPCVFRIYKDKRLVVTTATGVVTLAEGMANEDSIGLHPDFDPTFAHLIDAAGITKADLSTSDLAALARRTTFSSHARKAVLVSSPVLYGLGRVFETYSQLAGSESVHVFKDRFKALEWLGITGEV
jgi:hypothetical protein